MLNIYYGRESIDKEKFLFETIKDRGFHLGSPVILVVPDQYTLEAERRAFSVLQCKSLIGLDVYSFSRLGHHILSNVGEGRRTFIDKYGRQMLLARIAKQEEENLQVFGNSLRKTSFIEMVNDFISQLKQYDIAPEELKEIGEKTSGQELIRRKLEDLHLLYQRYQEAIEGKYTDSEDYIDLYIDKLDQVRKLKKTSVWVYGFDSIAPKSMKVLAGLMRTCKEVNVILTRDVMCRDEDLFELTELVQNRLVQEAREAGCELGEILAIPSESIIENAAISALERELFAIDPAPCQETEGVRILEAANLYSEAESAAAYVLHLLRDKGMRLRDIALVCNDQELRASILARVFEEYGIPLFHDNKRSIASHPIAVFLLAMLQTLQHRYRTTDLLRAWKSGLAGGSAEQVDALENYAIKYRIKGGMWKKPFLYGKLEYGEEGLAALEETRVEIMGYFLKLEKIVRESGTVADFLRAFYPFLTEELRVPEHLAEISQAQRDMGHEDLAEETEQVFGILMNLFDQIVELIGEDSFDLDGFTEILQYGIQQVEVGVLPSSLDDLMMGTMQRTRTGRVKALVIVGVNDGILPAPSDEDGLFAPEELEFLAEEGRGIAKLDRVRIQEERLAIYRNLVKPSQELWMSYSLSDETGKEARASELIDQILTILPNVKVEEDLMNQPDEMERIGGVISTMRHLAGEMRLHKHYGKLPCEWDSARRWMMEKKPSSMEHLEQSLHFENKPVNLAKEERKALFSQDQEERYISPTRLENYASCPFSYFVKYGLRPEEMRSFEAASREIGEVYHNSLMRISRQLTMKDAWKSVDYDTCVRMVREAIYAETKDYRDKLFSFRKEEQYKVNRMEKICIRTMWALVEHVRAGSVDMGRYEVPFGNRKGEPLPAITVETEQGTVYIEGTIDRLDTLENGRVKIIDYKSADLSLKEEEIRGGYRLQLMIYMAAASGQAKPAGVFYFHIQDPRVRDLDAGENDSDFQEKLAEKIRKAFQLKGILINDPETVREVAGDPPGESMVLGLRETAKGGLSPKSGTLLLSEEEFEKLQDEVKKKVEELVLSMQSGEILVHPMRISSTLKACTYCDFRAICCFDQSFEGCEYNFIDEVK